MPGEAHDGVRDGRLRVLVVDDHERMRALVPRVLEAAGDIEVVGTACDGRQGLDLAAELEPDVVVMDLSMPVLDGIAATRRLRAVSKRPAVVGLSGDSRLISSAIDGGAAECVCKSQPPGDLIAAVRRVASAGTPRTGA